MWKHPKYKTPFKGTYVTTTLKDGTSERVFVLQGKKKISFESWQAAKVAGWSKC